MLDNGLRLVPKGKRPETDCREAIAKGRRDAMAAANAFAEAAGIGDVEGFYQGVDLIHSSQTVGV